MTQPPRPDAAPPALATASGWFTMRTPRLPADVLAALGEGLAASGTTDPVRLADALAADRAQVRRRLRAIVARPEVREAIFLASPGLESRLGVWERDPDSRRGQQIERALLGYVARMAGRPTPFGLFAAVSIGAIGERTCLTLDGPASWRRRTRLDVDYLAALAEAIAGRPEVRARVEVRANPTLVRAAGRIRAAARQGAAASRAYRQVTADRTPYLEATLARAAGGARIADLARALVDDDPEIAPDEAEGFVHELIEAGLLVASIAPRITGGEPVADVVDHIAAHPELAGLAARLGDVQRALAEIDAGGGATPDRYREIARRLDGLPAPAPRSPFHVELVRGAPGLTLGGDAVTEVLRGVEILRRLSPPARGLRRFIDAFATRYGDAEVPLLEALDDDAGIGFEAAPAGALAVPLLAGLALPGEPPVAPFTARDALWLRKVEDARRRGQHCVELSAGELERVGHDDAPPLPAAFFAVARFAAASPDALASGAFTVLVASADPSAADLVAACRGDEAARRALADHLRAEEAVRPDAVFAEVVHLPEGQTGNPLVRPVLRDHEIPIAGRSGAPPHRQLPLGDLVVSIDRAERIIVRSLRLGREVIPRMTGAARPGARDLGVTRFLFALQHQGVAGDLAFRWGPLEALAFLPRVQAGRVVLARARWRLVADELRALAAPGAARFRAVQRLRDELGVPRRVEVGEAERWLPLDLDSAPAVDALAHLARGRADVVLREPFPALDELCAAGPDGRFVHELVIPFVRDRPEPARPLVAPARIARRFLPGSEWLQVDLYTAPGSIDPVIVALVAPWIAEALASGAADRWFFVRHAVPPPGSHLRVRVHGDPARLSGEMFRALQVRAAGLVEQGVIWNLALDGYQREIERYGGPAGIEIAEHMFHADSDAVAAILPHIAPHAAGDAGEIARWQLTLRGIDALLGDLGLDASAKLDVMRHGKARLARMRPPSRGLDRQLGAAYRTQRASLDALIDPGRDATGELAAPLAILHQRSARLTPWVRALRDQERAGRLTQTVAELAWSFVHMFTNRMFRTAALAQELVLYDWLGRRYDAALARERRGRPR